MFLNGLKAYWLAFAIKNRTSVLHIISPINTKTQIYFISFSNVSKGRL